jgi:acetyl esterase/lipase
MSNAMSDGAAFVLTADIPYLGADRIEKMDAYIPALPAKGLWPAVLLIHGGGWRIGDKANARELNIATHLTAQGYAVFSINYLLNTDESVAWPTNFTDCKAALRYLKQRASEFGVDPNRVAIMGGSAGGHLAMLVGATAGGAGLESLGLPTDYDDTVRCIIDFYGPHDVRGRRAKVFAGRTEAETMANAEMASPVIYFGSATPPIFIAHGTADAIVPVETSRELVEILKQRGIEHEYVEIPGAPHTFHLQPQQMDLRPAVLAFLARHLA